MQLVNNEHGAVRSLFTVIVVLATVIVVALMQLAAIRANQDQQQHLAEYAAQAALETALRHKHNRSLAYDEALAHARTLTGLNLQLATNTATLDSPSDGTITFGSYHQHCAEKKAPSSKPCFQPVDMAAREQANAVRVTLQTSSVSALAATTPRNTLVINNLSNSYAAQEAIANTFSTFAEARESDDFIEIIKHPDKAKLHQVFKAAVTKLKDLANFSTANNSIVLLTDGMGARENPEQFLEKASKIRGIVREELDNIAVHVLLYGEEIAPHTLLRQSPVDTKRCATDRELRFHDLQGTAPGKCTLEEPSFCPNILHAWIAVPSNGGFYPLRRPCTFPGTSREFLDPKCAANSVNNISHEKQTITDSAGRLLCDPLKRDIPQQITEALRGIQNRKRVFLVN